MSYAEILRILNRSTQFVAEDTSDNIYFYFELLSEAEARYKSEKQKTDKPWDMVGPEIQNFYVRIILSEKRNVDVDVDPRYIQ